MSGVLTSVSPRLLFRASSLVFAIVLATVFLKKKLNWQVAAGAALVVGGAVVIALSEPSE